MEPHQKTIDRLLLEAEEARLIQAVVVAAGEELLDRARALAKAIEEEVCHLVEWRDGYPRPVALQAGVARPPDS
jgi:hypothetical protein